METVSHQTILDALNGLIRTIGDEEHDETGRLKSTGLFARVKSVEDAVDVIKRERDRWRRDIVVATAVIAAVFGFVMWLEQDRIDHVRKVITTPAVAEVSK